MAESLSKQVAEIITGEFPEESPLEIALRILRLVAEWVERMPTTKHTDHSNTQSLCEAFGEGVKFELANIVTELRKEDSEHE